MRKNIQKCGKCGFPIVGDYRMALMMGPKGYRSYAVHDPQCVGKKAPATANVSLTLPSPAGRGKTAGGE